MDPQIIVNRLLRFVRLDTTVFEEMRDDANALIPAIVVVFASFLLMGLGGWLFWAISDFGDKGKVFFESTILGTIFATALWFAWVGVAWLLLTNVFHASGDYLQMLRSCSFAVLPMAIAILLFIPGLNLGIGFMAFGLTFLLMDIGVQVCTDAQPGQVIIATFAGFAVFCLVLSVLAQKSEFFGPGPFLFRSLAAGLADSISNLKSFNRSTTFP